MGKRYFFRMISLFFGMALLFVLFGSMELLIQGAQASTGGGTGTLALGDGEALHFGIVVGDERLTDHASGYLDDIHITPKRADSLAALAEQELDVVIHCGGRMTAAEVAALAALLDKGTDVLFLRLPGIQELSASANLRQLLGIREAGKARARTGVRFVRGFMMGDLADYLEYEYTAAEVALLPGAERYVYAITEEEKAAGVQNEGLLSLVWRYQGGGGSAYVVNGSFMETGAGYGILAALLATRQESFIYPVPAGYLLVVDGMPDGIGGDGPTLRAWYARGTQAVQTGLVLPTLESISRKYNAVPSFVGTATRLGGTAAEVFSDTIQRINGEVYYPGGMPLPASWAGRHPWLRSAGESGALPAKVLGLYWQDGELLHYRSLLTAYGLVFQTLAMEEILTPAGEAYNWINASLQLEEQTALLRNSHPGLPAVTLSDFAMKVEAWQDAVPGILYHTDGISVTLEEQTGPVQFLLRSKKQIVEITGGTYVQLEDGAWLVTAEAAALYIRLAAPAGHYYEN